MTNPDDDPSDGQTAAETHRYDRDTAEPCSHVVVNAVADALDLSPLDLEPLYHHVDPEALDALVDRSLGASVAENTSVGFDFADCRVEVSPVAVRVVTDEVVSSE